MTVQRLDNVLSSPAVRVEPESVPANTLGIRRSASSAS
jgi:hypothetical protein